MPTRHRAALALAVAAGLGGQASGQPLSAIDWLSDSLRAAPEATPGTARPVAESAGPGEVTVARLADPGARLPGLHDGSGLPAGLWDGATAAEVAAALKAVPRDLPGGLGDLLVSILTARVVAPEAALAREARLLVPRIDALLARGRLAEARALAEAGAGDDAAVFRRAFDIALLTGDENAACARLTETPALSPTWAARVFCLARNGQYDTAALTLGTADTLGMLSEDEEALLSRFLDPDLFGPETLGPLPRRPSPLEFRLWDAVGERIPTSELPIAFAHAELGPRYGWKTRLAAAERLAAAGALDPDTLFELYAEKRAAASGGVWERVEAVDRLRSALVAGEADTVAEALPPAWSEMRAAGLSTVFARAFAAALADADLSGEARAIAGEAALLANGVSPPPGSLPPGLLGLAEGLPGDLGGTPLGAAIAEGMSAPPTTEMPSSPGLAALAAMEDVAAGAEGDLRRVARGLAMLRAVGFEAAARQAALALLLAERDA